ncbi:MAG: S8 family serine peptidase [Leptospirales bacterium]
MGILHLESLRRTGATGKGVKVAVVDSGINGTHPHIGGIAGGIRIAVDENKNIYTDAKHTGDEIGHGTACAALIRLKAPGVSLHSIKIFENSLSTYTQVLIYALSWCIEESFDIINLSLGSKGNRHADSLHKVCRQAAEKNILIVSSLPPLSQSLPGLYPEVLGVCSDEKCGFDDILPDDLENFNCRASGNPRPLPGLPVQMNFKGDSLACAHVTGFMALLKEQQKGIRWKTLSETLKAYFAKDFNELQL